MNTIETIGDHPDGECRAQQCTRDPCERGLSMRIVHNLDGIDREMWRGNGYPNQVCPSEGDRDGVEGEDSDAANWLVRVPPSRNEEANTEVGNANSDTGKRSSRFRRKSEVGALMPQPPA